eukprot:363727-Chlamydomonas_euryale.AAC.2
MPDPGLGWAVASYAFKKALRPWPGLGRCHVRFQKRFEALAWARLSPAMLFKKRSETQAWAGLSPLSTPAMSIPEIGALRTVQERAMAAPQSH